jgi:hypothetical protein
MHFRTLVVSLFLGAALACGGAGSSMPAPLVGSWYAGRGGTSAPYDPVSGTFGTPNGSGLVYLFGGDGRYTKAFQSYASNGGCTSGYTAFEAGTVHLEGNSLVTTPSSGHLKYTDSCAPSLDSDTPTAPENLVVERFSYSVDGDQLVLQRDDGASSQFARLR